MEELETELVNAQQENSELSQQLDELNLNYRSIEQQLIEAKLQAATLDMEADQLTVQLSQKNDYLKKFSTRFTTMEIELVRLQALHGHTEDSVDETHDSERQAS